MFPMRVRKRKNGKTDVYWALAESYRTPRGSRHRIVGWLGELKGGAKSGWAELARQLNGKIPPAREPTRHAYDACRVATNTWGVNQTGDRFGPEKSGSPTRTRKGTAHC